MPLSLADIVQKVRTGVIRIEARTCDGEAIGTGFLVGPRLVATVEHVVDGATAIRLKRNGRRVGTAVVVGSDAVRDLALLRVSRRLRGYRFVFAAHSPRLGDEVAALGFPLGLPLTVTRGSVSGLDRTIPIEGLQRRRLVQTDAAVNPGNSGGPLLSLESEQVVGLVDLGTTQANGLAFAVSARVARPLVEAWTAAPQTLAATMCTRVLPPPPVVVTPTPPPPPPHSSVAARAAIRSAIRQHWALINKGAYEQAFLYLSPRTRASYGEAAWVKAHVDDSPITASLSVGAVSLSGNTATADIDLTTDARSGCFHWTGFYAMVKTSGRWFIDRANISKASCG